MFAPYVFSRIEKRNDCARRVVNRSDVAAFVFIANRAGQRQISFDGLPAVFLRDDVVNLMFRKADRFGNQTILTTAARVCKSNFAKPPEYM